MNKIIITTSEGHFHAENPLPGLRQSGRLEGSLQCGLKYTHTQSQKPAFHPFPEELARYSRCDLDELHPPPCSGVSE